MLHQGKEACDIFFIKCYHNDLIRVCTDVQFVCIVLIDYFDLTRVGPCCGCILYLKPLRKVRFSVRLLG